MIASIHLSNPVFDLHQPGKSVLKAVYEPRGGGQHFANHTKIGLAFYKFLCLVWKVYQGKYIKVFALMKCTKLKM